MNNRIFKQLAGALIATLLVATSAFAQGQSASHNAKGVANRADNGRNAIADDLNRALNGQLHGQRWMRQSATGPQYSVIVMATAAAERSDRQLNGLRRAIAALSGTVNRKFTSINGLAATVPAARIRELARHADVFRITPNRPVAAAASTLEKITGANAVRSSAAGGLDGSGVVIAILDSGIMSTHGSMQGDGGVSRVRAAVDFTAPLATLDSPANAMGSTYKDPYGHGTLVASIAAGRNAGGSTDSTGIAPGASLVDVRVLDANGMGDIATTIAGIDWVVANAGQYGIKVLNISLGTTSTDSYLTDPLCASARAAVAAGITVVVAAGNYGATTAGTPLYGTISSPGDEPSVITVGSSNSRGTIARGDDVVNSWSGRGPTRGAYVDSTGAVQHDNLIKPDLVAPGNRDVGAISTDTLGLQTSWLATNFPQLVIQSTPTGNGLMSASGTSFATPVVAGTAALLLQANPGLTPPLIKAILQYTAQPLANASLLDQGAGLVNVPGAVALADTLALDVAARVASGSISVGSTMLAPGESMPVPSSVIENDVAPWSQFVFMGGSHVLAGQDLFREYQAAYDPRLLWVGSQVAYVDPAAPAPDGALLSAGVVVLDQALGTSDPLAHTGDFTLSAQVAYLIGQGVVIAQGVEIADGIVVAEGVVIAEGVVVAEGVVIAEGVDIADGVVVAEQGPMPGE